jgi:acyl dehydratase
MTAVRPGDTRELLAVHNLTRTQIVQYAGASGDFNPVHTDERFATRVAGHPSVFAHGMLTMGLAGRILTDWFGVEAVKMFDAQFRRPVYPGAALTVSARVDSVDPDGTAGLSLAVRDGAGITVMTGSAVVHTG